MDDCGEGIWHSASREGWDGAGFEKRLDVWVGDVGIGVRDPFVIEDHPGSEGVWGP